MRLPLAVTLAVVVAALSPATAPRAQTPGWIADPRTGCRVWNPAPAPDESIDWSGGCDGGLAGGRGVLQWTLKGQPTDRYEGEMRAGRYEGRGAMRFVDGGRYDGDWRDGRAHGVGTHVGADGGTASGRWTDGCFDDGARQAWVETTKERCGFK
ncbi:MAG: hypothetical protein JNL07_08005 [Rhodospirillales bacterium]|nr:hypothetical protein [Rhodospirillales bacterium]